MGNKCYTCKTLECLKEDKEPCPYAPCGDNSCQYCNDYPCQEHYGPAME